MPTPVSAARQCLTDEAARALDDAVAVARRRSHSQTTSLHAVSALLALPSSMLRDACSRARSSAYSSRLQFRALELCVGVSLDRLPSSKTVDEPPVSNSLMAAIKRSQANQRRHPDNFHLQQIHYNNQQSASVLKVELKHFILSILDDPIVSRVFGEAGFRSCDIKIAIIHPPVTQSPKFSARPRCPPLFLCNLPGSVPGGPGFTFPPFGGGDENNRRIGDVMLKRSGKGRNPLLVGVCASDALRTFVECVNKGENHDKVGALGNELAGLRVVSVEKEVAEMVSGGGRDEAKAGSVAEGLGRKLEGCSGPGIVVNLGEVKVLVGENGYRESASGLVSKLTELLVGFKEKLWVMGSAESYDMYMKFLGQFPNVEKDWDLQLLPITSSSKSPSDGFGSKSSLIGSFVPFGGFFSSPFEFKNPLSGIGQSISRCHLCNAKYEEDVASILKVGSTTSVADQYSENLPCWLRMADLESRKGAGVTQAKDDGTTLNAQILGLQKKWNDICQCIHHAQPFSKMEISQARSNVSSAEGLRCLADGKGSTCSSSGSSRDSSLNESQCANPSFGTFMDLQRPITLKPVGHAAENVGCQSKSLEEASMSRLKEKGHYRHAPFLLPKVSLSADCASMSSSMSVITDLGLGTVYGSSTSKPNTLRLHEPNEHLQHQLGSSSADFGAVRKDTPLQIVQSSSCSVPSSEQVNLGDYKQLRTRLSEKVAWQDEAISIVSQVISFWQAGQGRRGASNDIWLTFLGPDKVGKKKIACAVADIIFGGHEKLVSVDMSSHDQVSPSNSVFDCEDSDDYDVKFRGKTVVDCIALELSKKPPLVIFLENVDKADIQARDSLSYAVTKGKFPDSHGRHISTNKTIFVTTSTREMGNENYLSEKESTKFPEERVLGAKCWQMKISVEHIAEDARRASKISSSVIVEGPSVASSMNKRKPGQLSDSTQQEFLESSKCANKALRCSLDLNLPVEAVEGNENDSDHESESISENSEAWWDEFLDQVDGKVVFKPFDFDGLADKITMEIKIQFERVFGNASLLVIKNEVMLQILAASWLSDGKRAAVEWVERVLSTGLTEARQKCHFGNGRCLVKLVSCEGLLAEDQAPGIRLPSTINL